MERNLTSGSVLKNILVFSLPYLFSYLLQTLYGMADLYIIGQFGAVSDTTAVSIGSQVMHMLTVMIVGLAMGATVFIGQAIGGQEPKKAAKGIGNTVTIFMLVSTILTAVLVLLVSPITAVMSTPADAVSGTIQYLTICFIGIPFITAYNVISSVFRGKGDSKTPMYFVAIACVSNISLDYLFIGVFHMKSAGAALGTTLSQAISVIISLVAIIKKDMGILLKRSDFKPKNNVMSEILKVGTPVALQDGFIQISFLLITLFANLRGLEDAAAVGIVEKIIGVLFLVPSAMLSTVSALSAQFIGAENYAYARKTLKYALVLSVSFGIFSVISMQLFAEPVIALFTDNNIAVTLGGQYMRGYVWDCILAGIHFCFSGYFCALKLSGISFAHNCASILLARIPLSYLAAKFFTKSLLPMGLASTVGSYISVIICIVAYYVIRKKQRKIYG